MDVIPNHKRFVSESDRSTQNQLSDGVINNRNPNLRASLRSNHSNVENEDNKTIANYKL
jgi:hypothetical protein